MRLLRARIADFGPLRGVDLSLDADLNVVYGRNEAGKTTLLDFLLSHLFRWERRTGTRPETVLGDLARFGDASESGRVELRLDGEVREYPGGPSLLHHLGLEHAGLAGLFCVRSGELELPERESGGFWRELKKVLAGLPEGVETLRKSAHDAAGLTPTGRLSDAGEPGRKTRYADLKERVETLSRLAGRLDDVTELAARIAGLEDRLERLDAAREARIAGLHAALEEARAQMEATPPVARERVERWARLEEEESRLERRIADLRGGVRDAAEEEARRRRALREAEARADALEDRLADAREADLEDRARRLEGAGPAEGVLRWADPAYRVGAVILVLAVGIILVLPSATLRSGGWIAGLLLALAAGGALFWFGRGLRRRRDERADRRAALLEDAAARELDVSAPGEVPGAVRALERDHHEARRELEGLRARREAAEERRAEREAERADAEARRDAIREEIADLREGLEPETLEAARERVREGERLRDRVEQLEAELQGLAGPDESAWRMEPPDAEDLPEWDAAERERVETRLERLRRRHREAEREFDRAGLPAPEDALAERERCREEIREIELDRDAGRLAGEVFASMGEALEERLARALERDGELSVAGLARRITGRYVSVRRGPDGGLRVRDREGRVLGMGELSRGARDQIYLALRLGLADAALEAARGGAGGTAGTPGGEGGAAAAADRPERGFFLLDDAFLTADWARRERLVAATADLADAGWQILYLTCDDHLRGLFTDAGARLHELQEAAPRRRP